MPGLATADANNLVSAEVRATQYTGASTFFLSLHSADPGTTGTNEITGGSYTRQPIAFAAPSAGTAASTANITFVGMPTVSVTHVGLWDAVSGPTFHQSGALTSTVPVAAGNSLQFIAGQITYNMQAV